MIIDPVFFCSWWRVRHRIARLYPLLQRRGRRLFSFFTQSHLLFFRWRRRHPHGRVVGLYKFYSDRTLLT